MPHSFYFMLADHVLWHSFYTQLRHYENNFNVGVDICVWGSVGKNPCLTLLRHWYRAAIPRQLSQGEERRLWCGRGSKLWLQTLEQQLPKCLNWLCLFPPTFSDSSFLFSPFNAFTFTALSQQQWIICLKKESGKRPLSMAETPESHVFVIKKSWVVLVLMHLLWHFLEAKKATPKRFLYTDCRCLGPARTGWLTGYHHQ